MRELQLYCIKYRDSSETIARLYANEAVTDDNLQKRISELANRNNNSSLCEIADIVEEEILSELKFIKIRKVKRRHFTEHNPIHPKNTYNITIKR